MFTLMSKGLIRYKLLEYFSFTVRGIPTLTDAMHEINETIRYDTKVEYEVIGVRRVCDERLYDTCQGKRANRQDETKGTGMGVITYRH